MSTNNSEDINMHTKYFVDADCFSFMGDKVLLKNDKSTWAKVVLNNLNLDDYLFSQNFVPQIKPDLGGRSISEFSFFNVRNIAERYQEKISNKKVAKLVSEVESSKTFSWDLRKKCQYCNDVIKTIYSKRTFPMENYFCSCNNHYFYLFEEREVEDENYEMERYIDSIGW